MRRPFHTWCWGSLFRQHKRTNKIQRRIEGVWRLHRWEWELKRKFLEANKGRYDEKTLVCYTQVFANAEFMGCRYPKETMDTIEEMSFGIVQPYRESMKNRLQRTFVSGSDAASGKVNRSKPGQAGKWIIPTSYNPWFPLFLTYYFVFLY